MPIAQVNRVEGLQVIAVDDEVDRHLVMAKRIDPLLPEYFGRLPRMPYGVRPIPDHIAPDTTTAYYQGPAIDGRRAGYYYVNLYKPEERPTYEIPVLSIHEAVPGHHLQIAQVRCLADVLSRYQRTLSATSGHAEGWALYAERLMRELGYLADDGDLLGMLNDQLFRAARVVVDIGMHLELAIPAGFGFHDGQRWTPELGLEFMLGRTVTDPARPSTNGRSARR